MSERYIVTGAAGFIGARFVEAARKRGAEVISVDVKTASESAFTSRIEHDGLDFGTTLDIEALAPWLERESPKDITAVIHMGACSDTMELDESVHERLNVAYSKMLWSWCAKQSVPLVYASSAATYGDGASGYDDDESRIATLQPLNPYGWSKQRFDLWALERERAEEHPPTWAGFKFFNVYGFGERHKGRMASVILHSSDQIQKSGQVKLFKSHKAGYGDGEQKRDFVYVEDVVDVLFHAASGAVKRGIYNLGTGQARTFADLARATFKALGKEPNIEFIDMPEALRERYQYFTEAKMDRLRAAGYSKAFTSLEDGAASYVKRLLAHGARASRDGGAGGDVKTDTKFLIDRTIALPLAWATNLAARTAGPILQRDHKVKVLDVKTIAVAKLLGMGSIIQATPMLRDLRRSFPKAKIIFLTTKANRGLIERLDTVDEGIYVDDSEPQVLATTTARAVAQLLARRVDLYFDLEVYSAGASVLSVLSGARNRVGFYRGSARFKKGLYTHLTVFNPRVPISAIYRQLHLCVGGRIGGPPEYGPIAVAPKDVASLGSTLAKHSLRVDSKYVVVNANASDLLLERRWPIDKYVQLIVELASRGEQIVLVGAKSEAAYVGEIMSLLPGETRSRVVDTSGKLSLGELFALIKGAACTITNDTGPMHFSIALDRPTVCLFGPVSPDHYGVRKPNVETLYHAVYCSPRAHEIDTPPCAGVNVCMQLIEVPEVLAAVHRQLEGKPAPTRLPIVDVAYAAPQGGALGVIVRSSVESAADGGFVD